MTPAMQTVVLVLVLVALIVLNFTRGVREYRERYEARERFLHRRSTETVRDALGLDEWE